MSMRWVKMEAIYLHSSLPDSVVGIIVRLKLLTTFMEKRPTDKELEKYFSKRTLNFLYKHLSKEDINKIYEETLAEVAKINEKRTKDILRKITPSKTNLDQNGIDVEPNVNPISDDLASIQNYMNLIDSTTCEKIPVEIAAKIRIEEDKDKTPTGVRFPNLMSHLKNGIKEQGEKGTKIKETKYAELKDVLIKYENKVFTGDLKNLFDYIKKNYTYTDNLLKADLVMLEEFIQHKKKTPWHYAMWIVGTLEKRGTIKRKST